MLRVVPANELKIGPEIYSMTRNPRGSCIIVNNAHFDDHSMSRKGSELDVDRMAALFRQLHFNVSTASNLSAKETKDLLRRFQKAETQKDAECLVVILMSNGKEGVLYGSDGEELHLDRDVYQLFDNENCPNLRGKPKLFFIQGCRGCMWDNGIHGLLETPGANEVSHEHSEARSCEAPPRDDKSCHVPETASTVEERPEHCLPSSWQERKPETGCSDMYIAYATRPGYVSLKNARTGSWFLSAVSEVFSEHACTLSLDGLMRRVCQNVVDRSAHDGSKQTPSVTTIGWRKELYFNPGHHA
ncbi:caspase-2-like [Haemaphysalis longicornis]